MTSLQLLTFKNQISHEKKLLTAVIIMTPFIDVNAQSYKYKMITSVKSIVLLGVGRYRIISSDKE